MYAVFLAFVTMYSIVAVPLPQHERGSARAINAAGVVAGSIEHDAFTWDGRRLVRYPATRFGQGIPAFSDGPYASAALSINRNGVAVGGDGTYAALSSSGLEFATATLYRDGVTRILDASRMATFEASGINDRGVIVGVDGYRGFFRKPDGAIVNIEPLSTREEYNGTRAAAIDNKGRIVGGTTIDVPWYRQDDQRTIERLQELPIHAFLFSPSLGARMRDLGVVPGFLDSFATAVNGDLTIVGYSGTSSFAKTTQLSGPSHAWLWKHGRMSDLGVLHPRESSYAYGVNDAGVVVGCSGAAGLAPGSQSSYDAAAKSRATVWVNGRIADLNDLVEPGSGWTLLCAYAINGRGWIVGDGILDGAYRPFLLVPKAR